MRQTDHAYTTHAFDRGDLSPSRARRLAANFLGALARRGRPVPPDAVEIARLVTSELVTNALKHAPGPVLLELRLTAGLFAVTVRDSSPALPVVGDTDPTRVGRHGLEVVTAVAPHFEVRVEPDGKRVTAAFALDGATAPAPVPAHEGKVTGADR
ncbi:ATP-binding protein [Streptomyces sp. NPDC085460]|uniref:ATP-binding protein n=1 Tax=Streptomyces sp. NPDC085460 TaxID=3365723 RepID=UPI0037CD4B64